MEQLQSLPEAQRGSEQALKLKAIMMLEMAFGLHLTHETTVHKTSGEYEVFHLLLNGGEQGAFDLAYVYSAVTGELMGTRVDDVPKGWKLMFARQTPEVLHVETPGPVGFAFLFDLTNPFRARVADYPD